MGSRAHGNAGMGSQAYGNTSRGPTEVSYIAHLCSFPGTSFSNNDNSSVLLQEVQDLTAILVMYARIIIQTHSHYKQVEVIIIMCVHI